MGATTKSITGLFANVCGRNLCGRIVREQIAAGVPTCGSGTRSAATQGYLPLSLFGLSHLSWRDPLACLARFFRLGQARDQARWLLKRLGGQPTSALPSMSGILRPAWCPARQGSGASGRPQTGVGRFDG